MLRQILWLGMLAILLTGCSGKPATAAAKVEKIKPYSVYLTVGGETMLTAGYEETVSELLQRLDVPITGNWRVSEPLDEQVYDQMRLQVDLHETIMQVYYLPSPYGTTYCYDPSLPKGQEELLFPGVQGQLETVVEVSCVNGIECSYSILEQTPADLPVNQIIAVGTGEKENQNRIWPLYGDHIIVLETGEVLTYTHTGQFSATAYTSWVADVTGTTATGTKARVGAIAVDPRVIPYGTKMFIVTNDGEYIYGKATAEDCGGAVKGNIVDLFFDTLEECYAFGRRRCTIYFLG